MALEGCYSCIKYTMFVFNFLFWLIGCAMLGVGIWLKVDQSGVETAKSALKGSGVESYIEASIWTFIVIGSVILIIGFLGCCGAIRESQCLLALFFIFLFLIFIILLAVSGLVLYQFFTDQEPLKLNIKKSLEALIKNYENDQAEMNAIQAKYHCCGASQGITDYIKLDKDWYAKAVASCGLYQAVGCTDKVLADLRTNMPIVAGVIIGIAVIILIGMIFSMSLCCAIKRMSD